MKNYTTTLIATFISTSLIACGGGGSPSSEPIELPTVSGMAIDGYIVGARAFMDLNFNSLWDEGEPFAITKTPTDVTASWSIEIPATHEDCSVYVPYIVHVPVGATDMDDPENPITEEYYLVTPPPYTLTTNKDLLNVTPLSTLVWTEIERELTADGSVLSCEKILAEEALRLQITERVSEQAFRVALRYNITADSLYSDYVAEGNSELHGLARSLVPGFAKSYAETVILEEANPTADVAFVEYYFGGPNGGGMSTNMWSRREFIQASSGNFTDISNDMNSALKTIGELKSALILETSTSNGIELVVQTSFDGSICGITEDFTEYNNLTGYTLTNVASLNDTTWTECQSMDKVTNTISQRQGTSNNVLEGGELRAESYSTHTFNTDNSGLRVELIGATTSDFSAGWLSDTLSYISLDYLRSA